MDVRFRLDGKVALVTGAAGALGAHFAATLGGAGATVVLAGRRLQPLQDLAAQLQNNNIQAHAISMDVSDHASVEQGFEQDWSRCGAVEILVCNEGVQANNKSIDISADERTQVVDDNQKGRRLVGNNAARRLVDAGRHGDTTTLPP